MYWTIRYSPHRIETTVPMNLGSVTWHHYVTWNGYLVAFTTWMTA